MLGAGSKRTLPATAVAVPKPLKQPQDSPGNIHVVRRLCSDRQVNPPLRHRLLAFLQRSTLHDRLLLASCRTILLPLSFQRRADRKRIVATRGSDDARLKGPSLPDFQLDGTGHAAWAPRCSRK